MLCPASGTSHQDLICRAVFAYFIVIEVYIGRIIGKRLLHMKVVDNNSNRIGLRKLFILGLLRIVDVLPAYNILGIVMIASLEKGQRFGEHSART